MKPKSIGIVGGAGPLAGAALLNQVLALSTSLYGCYKDADFPKIVLISFPFSEMLTQEMDPTQVQKELSECLAQLRNNSCDVLAIACNTLHAFLNEDSKDLIHLPKELAKEIRQSDIPLVLCTSTSMQYGLHRRYFPCVYPNANTQAQIDTIIDLILKGTEETFIIQRLLSILQAQCETTIILGCTELSLFKKYLSLPNKLIIDPLEIIAKKLLQISFQDTRRSLCQLLVQ